MQPQPLLQPQPVRVKAEGESTLGLSSRWESLEAHAANLAHVCAAFLRERSAALALASARGASITSSVASAIVPEWVLDSVSDSAETSAKKSAQSGAETGSETARFTSPMSMRALEKVLSATD